MQFMKRWQVDHYSLASFSEACLSCARVLYPRAPSCDRLTAISIHWALFCILDDAFFVNLLGVLHANANPRSEAVS
jgi:hypothetical protein